MALPERPPLCGRRLHGTTLAPRERVPQQFDNPANSEIHRKTTAVEIANDFPDGLDYIITGVGTGGHITGVAEVLKAKWPNLKVFAVEPELSPVLSGGSPSPHPLQGIGAGFVPSILNTKILDGIIQVGKDEAFAYAQRAAKEEGIFVGVSTGASLAAVDQPQSADAPTWKAFNSSCRSNANWSVIPAIMSVRSWSSRYRVGSSA